jgi:hypothetical protein
MSVLNVVGWALAPLAGVALGLRMRSTTLALLLGLALVITTFVLWGYSWNYSNNDCQPGEPCPTGYHVIQIVDAVLFPLGSVLFVVALARGLWRDYLRGLRNRRRSWPGRDA